MFRTIRLAAIVSARATVIPQHASAYPVAGGRIFVNTPRYIARGYLACSLVAHPPPRRLAALLSQARASPAAHLPSADGHGGNREAERQVEPERVA